MSEICKHVLLLISTPFALFFLLWLPSIPQDSDRLLAIILCTKKASLCYNISCVFLTPSSSYSIPFLLVALFFTLCKVGGALLALGRKFNKLTAQLDPELAAEGRITIEEEEEEDEVQVRGTN